VGPSSSMPAPKKLSQVSFSLSFRNRSRVGFHISAKEELMCLVAGVSGANLPVVGCVSRSVTCGPVLGVTVPWNTGESVSGLGAVIPL